MDQLGTAASPARGQLNRENEYSLSPFAPEKMVSRDGFGRPAPRQPAHSPYILSQAEYGTYRLLMLLLLIHTFSVLSLQLKKLR